MKDYQRQYPSFSLCGLFCGLCPIHHMENGCPGCGGGDGHQPCAVIRCGREHGGPEFCCDCPAYPCERYLEPPLYDQLLPSRNARRDLDRLKAEGLPTPTFIVGQTGTLTRLTENVGHFNADQAVALSKAARVHGVGLKEHNGDYLSPFILELHPALGIPSTA